MNSKNRVVPKQRRDPYRIVKESLAGGNACLINFFFRRGGNIYVFSYNKSGVTKYTFIDTGDPRHRDHILSILTENGINPANIEKIIITHRHVDHCGLAELLARVSNAEILVHSNFRSFVEGEMEPYERTWFGDFQASNLKKHNITYLSQSDGVEAVNISGIDFPGLIKPVSIDGEGKIYILGCPDSIPTHSPDQVIVVYSKRSNPFQQENNQNNSLPTDDILFSGDLWLMHGPFHHLGLSDVPRLVRFGLRNIFQGRNRRNHREQDAAAKEALKRGFCLIRVKPGHGDEFVGSRIIPYGLLADRDILLELGYGYDVDKSLLKGKDIPIQMTDVKEQAYLRFVKELRLWMEIGYTPDQVSRLLVRIYSEQSGGSKLVKKDREQRRVRLKDNLLKLCNDTGKEGVFHQLAETTLAELRKL